MFRIKTDIRQYKCETKDKVEKLIRNWVIRPNDLIYNTSDKVWSPIGEHPTFTGLFDVLDEHERNTPDTVVTAQNPYSGRSVEDQDDEPAEVAEPQATNGEAPAPAAEADHVEEVTQLVERPDFKDDAKPSATAEAARAETNEDAGEEDVANEVDEARETDVFDQEEVAQSLADAPQPPAAPDGVEPLATDEVTTMTERTLDMLKITDEEDGVEPPPAAADDDSEATADEDEVDVVGATEDDEDGEVTGVREKAVEAEADAGDTPVLETVAADDDEPTMSGPIAKDKQPRLGRHDLPEELFATNEISSPEVLAQMKKLDELAELSEPSEPTTARPGPKRPIAARVRLEEDSGVDEAWDAIVETVPTEAEEVSAPEAIVETEALRETDEIDGDDDEASEPEDHGVLDDASDVSDDEDDDDLDDEYDDDLDDDDYDDDDLDDDDEPLEQVAIEPVDFISEGYSIPLPYVVRPTPDDIRRGLKLGKASEARKNRTYPRPEPKKLDEIHRRYFDLEPPPPRDQTWAIVLGVMVVIAIIVSVVVTSC